MLRILQLMVWCKVKHSCINAACQRMFRKRGMNLAACYDKIFNTATLGQGLYYKIYIKLTSELSSCCASNQQRLVCL